MFAALIPTAISLISKFVGGHLVENHLLRGVTGATGTLGALGMGLGLRFVGGILVALYATQPDVRAGINLTVKAIGAAVLPGVF